MALNIIFMGTPNFAVPILKSINDSEHNILAVYTQKPKKKDRGQKINISPIHEFSNTVKLQVRYPIKFDKKECDFIKNLKPDVVIVVAYGKILPSTLLNLKKIKFLNIHASLLPKWRGAAPIERAIMNLDKKTGISIMKIVPKLDSGPVMMKSEVDIFPDTNYENLSTKLISVGSNLILKSLKLIEKKDEIFVNQNESEATYAKKIEKSETKINFNTDAKKIIATINAFSSTLGAWLEINGTRIKVLKAKELKLIGPAGQIIDKNFTIGCLKNSIQVLELKKEGKNKMKASEFLRGNNLKIGINVN